jgi:hypothetical protein
MDHGAATTNVTTTVLIDTARVPAILADHGVEASVASFGPEELPWGCAQLSGVVVCDECPRYREHRVSTELGLTRIDGLRSGRSSSPRLAVYAEEVWRR